MRGQPHVSRKKFHKKKEYETNKNKQLTTTGKMYFPRANKNTEYQVCPANIRKQRTVNASLQNVTY